MMKKIICLLAVILVSYPLFSAEFLDGRIKLVINERTGRFSLYYMADLAAEAYLPFFDDADPRTSFLSVMVHNRNYKMGESSLFRTSLGGTPKSPALVFESSFLVVTQQFSFVKTGDSKESNGVTIAITIHNKSEHDMEAGIRFLVDTALGEKSAAHFLTASRQISEETSAGGSSGDVYWVSKNNRLSLAGSIAQDTEAPDEIIFANWKRLHDAVWKPAIMPGRNFNLLPYSIEDSAVCYFYEQTSIAKGESRTVSLTLSGGDGNFSAQSAPANPPLAAAGKSAENMETAAAPGAALSMRNDLVVLRDLLALLDAYASGKTEVSGEELDAAAILISGIKSKYSIP